MDNYKCFDISNSTCSVYCNDAVLSLRDFNKNVSLLIIGDDVKSVDLASLFGYVKYIASTKKDIQFNFVDLTNRVSEDELKNLTEAFNRCIVANTMIDVENARLMVGNTVVSLTDRINFGKSREFVKKYIAVKYDRNEQFKNLKNVLNNELKVISKLTDYINSNSGSQDLSDKVHISLDRFEKILKLMKKVYGEKSASYYEAEESFIYLSYNIIEDLAKNNYSMVCTRLNSLLTSFIDVVTGDFMFSNKDIRTKAILNNPDFYNYYKPKGVINWQAVNGDVFAFAVNDYDSYVEQIGVSKQFQELPSQEVLTDRKVESEPSSQEVLTVSKIKDVYNSLNSLEEKNKFLQELSSLLEELTVDYVYQSTVNN